MDARPDGSIPRPTVTRQMRLRRLLKVHAQLLWAVVMVVLGAALLFANHGGLVLIVIGVVVGVRHLSNRDATRSSP